MGIRLWFEIIFMQYTIINRGLSRKTMKYLGFIRTSASGRAVEQVNLHVHLPVPSACTFYIAPEDGCVLHPKHVEQIV